MLSYQGRSPRTVNLLKTIYFDGPTWTICRVSLMPATWMRYRAELEDLVRSHPRIFPEFVGGWQDQAIVDDPLFQPGRHTDCWGSVWENIEPGLSSIVVHHPLEDWAALEGYQAPDPLRVDVFGPRNWDQVIEQMDAARVRGELARGGGLPHGFMYMRLYYLRGFDNLMLDLAQADPRLDGLIERVESYNSAVIKRYVELGAEYLAFGDDLGLQTSLPMSPTMWRRTIKPSYLRMLAPCRDADLPVALHTDGHILEIIPDLIACGVRLLNPQIRANGLKGLERIAKGKVAINLDLDRQLFPFASPAQIRDHIHEAYEALHLPEGGLMLSAECEPDVSLDKIEAICCALEETCGPPLPSEVDSVDQGDAM